MPKQHNFLKLKIGCVDECAMIIKKKHLAKWQKRGWLTYKEVGLPKGDETAEMVYGFLGNKHTLIFHRPPTLAQTNLQNLIGRKVKGFSTYLGTYGMGGASCFGLLLNHKEFLTYAVWGSSSLVALDNRPIKCSQNDYKEVRPWTSNLGDDLTWDELTAEIKNSVVRNIEITKASCTIILQKNEKTMRLAFVKTDDFLPHKKEKTKVGFKKGKISDYLIFHPKKSTLVV